MSYHYVTSYIIYILIIVTFLLDAWLSIVSVHLLHSNVDLRRTIFCCHIVLTQVWLGKLVWNFSGQGTSLKKLLLMTVLYICILYKNSSCRFFG